MWACASMPPGSTSLPLASISLAPAGEIAADSGDHAVLDADVGVELVDRRGNAAAADHAIECGLWHLTILHR